MALGVTDLKKGTIFQFGGVPYKVVDYAQKVMGRGGSIVNVRIKSLIDGRVLEKTFKGNEQLDSADVITKTVQYLYAEQGVYYFMDQASYEQFELSGDEVKAQTGYLKEGDNTQALFFNGQLVGLDLPKNVYLAVTYAEPAVKGDTSSAITKDAQLETGIKIKVPAFIKTGDILSVDTATGAYRARATSSGRPE